MKNLLPAISFIFFPTSMPWFVLGRGFLFLFCFFFLSHPKLCGAETPGWVVSTRNSILALSNARSTVLEDIAKKPLGQGESSDYHDFLVFLNNRISTYCQELHEREGTDALEGLPCPETSDEAMSSDLPASLTLDSITSPSTSDEKGQLLDNEFKQALGEFDDFLLQEEEKISARVPSQRESGDGGQQTAAAGSGGARGGVSGTKGQSVPAVPGSETVAPGSAGSTQTTAVGTTDPGGAGDGVELGDEGISGSGVTPAGRRPPPVDKDIVARQLREAAEKETDPELKKKLWEEYWKYKGVSHKNRSEL